MADSARLILMLEDESERLTRFDFMLAKLGASVEWRHWRTAPEFVAGFQAAGRTPSLICLDHDLFTDHPDDPDPGDGRDVAQFMAAQKPCCHVIIHSSNAHAADSMYFTLADANWDVERIAPLGHDWIESYWWFTAKPWITT
ncbi:MAG: cyclic-phosphate processing receiver domain-containing protein [Planctomycetota bacterium]